VRDRFFYQISVDDFLVFLKNKIDTCDANEETYIILLPSQNISKNWSTKVNVFGSKFILNTSTYFDIFLLTFWNGKKSWNISDKKHEEENKKGSIQRHQSHVQRGQ